MRIGADLYIEEVEEQLSRYPLHRLELEDKLRELIIFGPMKKRGVIELLHVRPEGKVLSLRGGKILSFKNGELIIKREFSTGQGQYDGLELPIEQGDYSLTHIRKISGLYNIHIIQTRA